ncbi:hypothetical protein N0V83_010018 [Neocucurbitaria cava]|uniref:Queuine tRNA-ribosyltransferase catalytic subunit 1 n=1 Tax=Neocucurbitaria cava TaxID=798079 RepID=A0A9W8Y161_9PLEO|nr:hypothetical protein N0V83_010018 [Neocucurbitaria cava]
MVKHPDMAEEEVIYPNRLQGHTIRLLELLPDDTEETPIQCRLIEASLDDDCPPFEALSYVWGDATITETIGCNGRDMQVTTNLAQALRKIRPRGAAAALDVEDRVEAGGRSGEEQPVPTTISSTRPPKKLFWVDAICINQKDVRERNHQVPLMKEIYSRAAGVTVWLGPANSELASRVASIIKQVCNHLLAYRMVVEQLRATNSAPSWLKGRGHFTFELCEASLRASGIENPWAALRVFFQLPWWSRTWCVQEVYLAQDVTLLFGTESIDGKNLTEFTQWFMRESTFENAKGLQSKCPSELNDTAVRTAYSRFNHRNLNARDLFMVCEDFRNLDATDARDKVYGLLGLWRPTGTEHASLDVNYGKSVAEVYTDVVLQAISARQDLFILRFVDHETEYRFDGHDGFPSWVPRWDHGEPWQFGWLDKSPLRASQYAAERPDQELARSGVLKVKGVLFDRVVWTSDVLEQGPISFLKDAAFRNRFIQLYKEASGMEPNPDFWHQISVPELATSISCGYIKMGDEMLDKDIDDPNAWLDVADLDSDTGRAFLDSFRTFMDTDTYPGDPKAFHKLMLCSNRRLFRTSRGYLGLGRRNMRPGDFVSVLHGGKAHAMRQSLPEANDTMAPVSMPSALKFELLGKCSVTKARAATLHLPHGPVPLPIFMPVATQASLKGLTPDQLEDQGCRLCLNNTYHLGLKPGQATLDAIGGAHKLQSWPHNILTDSGGFQMVSLLKLAQVTEEGVRFLSPHDGSPMLLTPEHSISLQNSIGSDIIMQLDDVIATTSPDAARMREAMERSVRWLDRCIAAHKYPERQNLFCIIQGGLDLELRRECTREMVARDTPGIAIGGLSGGEEKNSYCRVVDACTDLLPEGKPRYVMGVGYPEDLVVSIALGADMFDCVWPTRTARFGNAITPSGALNLRNARYATDFRPITASCTCPVCRPVSAGGLGLTRAYMYHVTAKETAGAHLLTMHNVHYQLSLMREAREAILQDAYPAFVRGFWHVVWRGEGEVS